MILRAATAADVPAVTAIYNSAVEHTTASYDLEPVSLTDRLAWFEHKVQAGWPVLVAEEDGEVVGWGSFGPFREKAGYRHTVEHSVYVRADQRGGGIGSALLETLVAEARSRALHVMIGGVDADNAASIAFHERHGFRVVGRLPQVGRKFDRWLDLVYLHLDLEVEPAADEMRPVGRIP